MTPREKQLVAVAKAEDTYDLLQHIAWTEVLKPALDTHVRVWTQQLVQEALGSPLPNGLTREQVAGRCYGVQYITTLMERILKEGKSALTSLQGEGISINNQER